MKKTWLLGLIGAALLSAGCEDNNDVMNATTTTDKPNDSTPLINPIEIYDPYLDCPVPDPAVSNQQVIDHLLITEISEPEHFSDTVWFEIYNPTSQTIQLKDYWFITHAIKSDLTPHIDDVQSIPMQFDFPVESSVAPGQHLIVKSATNQLIQKHTPNTNNLAQHETMVKQALVINFDNVIRILHNNLTFYWSHEASFIELIRKTDGQSIDFVRFGTNTQTPLQSTQWLSTSAVPSFNHPNRVTSIARRMPYQDTNTIDDWSISLFQTPGHTNLTATLTNDVLNIEAALCNDDLDQDNIPDCKEEKCQFYNGLPYHAWGARPQQTDVFVQLDYMRDGSFFPEKVTNLMRPRHAALKQITEIFEKYSPANLTFPIKIHFDTGTLFSDDKPHNINRQQFNLYSKSYTGLPSHPGGNELTFSKYMQYLYHQDSLHSLTYYRDENLDPRRSPVFHYGLIGYQFSTNPESTMGMAELAKDKGQALSFAVGLGGLDKDQISEQDIVGTQVSAIMHTLGHNFGLKHGGHEHVNFKPNYYSVMNYAYAQNLPDVSMLVAKLKNSCHAQVHRFIWEPTQTQYINFSNGSGQDIDQYNINENSQFFNDSLGTLAIDYNNTDTFDNGVSCNLAIADTSVATLPAVLTDYNDWGQIAQTAFGRLSKQKTKREAHLPEITFCDLKH
jgi:hypothetical protein